MNKYLNLLLCSSVLAAFASQASAIPLTPIVTDWSPGSYSGGSSGTVSGTLPVGAGSVSVTFTGDLRDLQENHTTVFNNTGQISGQTIYTPSLSISDAVGTWGGTGTTNTITFSSPVMNPIIWINSLGRGGDWDPLTYVQTWTFNTPFTLLSSLYIPGGDVLMNFEANPYQLTVSGMDLIGQEGHGSIQFSGLISSISWTSDISEQSAYFQVGYEGVAIPEPSTYAALFGVLALAGTIYWKRNRRVTG
jgi:hypothetical protein